MESLKSVKRLRVTGTAVIAVVIIAVVIIGLLATGGPVVISRVQYPISWSR